MNKKLLSALLFTAITTGVSAQFSQTNEPVINNSRQLFLLDSNTVNYENVTGNSAVWNYAAALNENSVSNIARMMTVVSPAAGYPGATKATEIEGYATTYFSSTATERVSQGFSFPEPTLGLVEAKFTTNSEKLFNYPFAFNGTFTDAVAGDLYVQVMGTPIVAPVTGTATVTYDGLGTLNFPDGSSLTNVTRVKSTDVFTGTITIGGFITIPFQLTRIQMEYYDLASANNLPVFIHSKVDVINTTTSNPLSRFNVVLSSRASNVSLTDEEFSGVAVYPNPSSDMLNVTGISGNNASAILLDQQGRVISTQLFSNGSTSFDVSTLDAGSYILKMTSNGKTTSRLVAVN